MSTFQRRLSTLPWTVAEVDPGPDGKQYWATLNGVKVHVYHSPGRGWVARYDEQYAFETAERALGEAEAHIARWDLMDPV